MIWLHVIHPQTLSSDHVIAQWAKEIYMYYADLNTQYDALLLMLPTRIMISAGRGSKMEAENRAARGRFSMGNLD